MVCFFCGDRKFKLATTAGHTIVLILDIRKRNELAPDEDSID
jgi:hypothetical protein